MGGAFFYFNVFFGSSVSTLKLRGTTKRGGRQINIFRETVVKKMKTASLMSCGKQFSPPLAEVTFGFMDSLQKLFCIVLERLTFWKKV